MITWDLTHIKGGKYFELYEAIKKSYDILADQSRHVILALEEELIQNKDENGRIKNSAIIRITELELAIKKIIETKINSPTGSISLLFSKEGEQIENAINILKNNIRI